MKKSNRITSGVIILSMLASSTILCMTSCSGEQSNATSAEETTEMSVEETTEEPMTEIFPDTTEWVTPQPYEPEEDDYSIFGFYNNYGMTEWMSIRGYSIDGSSDSYVYDAGSYKFTFSDSFFKSFEKYSNGYQLSNTAKCSIEDNDSMTFTTGDFSGTSMIITERKTPHNIPVIVVECNENYWGHKIIDGTWFIPTDFIDWERSPEKGTHTDKNGKTKNVTKYYINEEYLQ